MMEAPAKFALQTNAAMLAQIQSFFGEGMVVGAWIAQADYGVHNIISTPEERLKEDMEHHIQIEDQIFNMDAVDLVIEFFNGKKVVIGNSEWGSIAVFDSEFYFVEPKQI